MVNDIACKPDAMVALSDDQLYVGYQGTTDSTNFSGGGGTDGLTVAAPLGKETAFIAAGTAAG